MDITHTPIFSLAGAGALALSAFASPLPDVDQPESTIAKMVFPLAWACELLHITHRTFTHSFVAAGLWFWLAFTFQKAHIEIAGLHLALFPILFAGGAIGYLSHIAIDMLNRMGQQLFWPFPQRYAFYLVSSNGIANELSKYVFFVAFIVVAFYSLALQAPFVRAIFAAVHHAFPIFPLA
ncbi:metal-dependent hydrolase [Sulfoacidibacillus thermotolerans]|uniref:metal-dependent hydrolase n=1 Tax=Sulfoacidibacillus thermotolerans TaxID=1765684 RepID=UPI001FE555FB|nr:metal-dependent hydrolase [Sulfoacidibacillus thermotolerans]